MTAAALLPIFASLFVAGIAGSLHCIGMCGPLLVGFAQTFRAGPAAAAGGATGQRSLAFDFAGYHAGRIWTYAMLGLAAGFVGDGLRRGSALLGWQRPLAVALAVAVIVSGLLLLGFIPGLSLDRLASGCGLDRLRRRPSLRWLLGAGPLTARLLLGAVMGLLPCGLVYAMLVLVATLPHPALSALGMIAFGIGTLPALSAALVAARILPARLRLHGSRIAAVALIATGAWMLARALFVDPATAPCPACVAGGE